MRRTTFRQLEVFEAIARLGSFTRAAEELYLSQPTASMQVKKLADVCFRVLIAERLSAYMGCRGSIASLT